MTVVVPHYNSTQSLERLLASIPSEPWIEVVVVDDNSVEPLDALKVSHPLVRFLQLPRERKGAGAARNFAIENSSSDWLLFADADDFFTPGAFEKIHEYIDSNFDVVYFSPTSFNEKSGNTGVRHLHYENLLEEYLSRQEKSILYRYFVPWSKLVSRPLVEKHGIRFDEVVASNDMNFSLKIAFHGAAVHVDRSTIYCVTEGANSLTKQSSLAVLESRFYAAVRYNQFLQAHQMARHQIGVNFQIYNIRRFGIRKVTELLIYALQHRMPLLKGLKPLAKQIFRDISGRT